MSSYYWGDFGLNAQHPLNVTQYFRSNMHSDVGDHRSCGVIPVRVNSDDGAGILPSDPQGAPTLAAKCVVKIFHPGPANRGDTVVSPVHAISIGMQVTGVTRSIGLTSLYPVICPGSNSSPPASAAANVVVQGNYRVIKCVARSAMAAGNVELPGIGGAKRFTTP